MESVDGHGRAAARRTWGTFSVIWCAALTATLAAPTPAAPAAADRTCRVTVPTRVARPGPVPSAAGFNYGGRALRAHLYWSAGRIAAGILPDGGSMATVGDDGSIHVKLGWWRGVPGRLVITGRRLDAEAPRLRAEASSGYGPRGFQPSGLVFPTVGCWEVLGRVGDVRLRFVVRVTKLAWH